MLVLVLVLVLPPLAALGLDSTVLPTNKEATRIDGGTWPREARLWEDRLEKERKKEKYEGRQRLVSCKRALIYSNRLSRVSQGRQGLPSRQTEAPTPNGLILPGLLG